MNPETATAPAQRLNEMLAAISRIQTLFLTRQGRDAREVFDALLAELLRLSSSEYGFIGEALYDERGAPYLKTYALTNVAWNDETRRFFEENAPKGLEFRNLDTLFGAALRTRSVVISNDPGSDTRRGGLPRGHPPLDAFLGIPFVHAERLVGMVGIANRPGGYCAEVVQALQPMLDTVRTLIVAHRASRARDEAEAELRRSAAENRRLAAVASMTINGVVVTDAQGAIVWVNDGFTRMTGWSLHEVRGLTPMKVLHGPETDRALTRSLGEQLLRGEGFSGVELLSYRKGGERFWVSVEVRPVLDAHGEVEQFIGIHTDVTEARALAESQRASEAKFAAAFHGSADYIVLTRLSDGQFIEVNDAAVRLTGTPREQLLGRTALQLGLWAEPSQRETLQARLRDERQVSNFACTLRRGDGELRECLMSATVVDVRGEACQLTMVHDVTSERRAEAALRESELRLRAVFDSSVDAIVVIDERGAIEAVNPACERMFGWRLADLRGKNVSLLMQPSDAERHDAWIGAYREGRPPRVIGVGREVLARRRDGEVFPIELSVSEMGGAAGRRFAGTIRDISERKRAEASALRLNAELKASVAELEQVNRDSRVLSEMRDLLQTCQNVDEVHQVSRLFVDRLLPDTRGALYLLDGGRATIEAAFDWGGGAPLEAVFAHDACWALRRGRPFGVPAQGPALHCSHLRAAPEHGYSCVPLSAQGEELGLLHVQFGPDAGSSGSERLHRLVATLAEYVALAIANVRMRETLRRQATRDPLTGLQNRRQMDEALDREIRRAARRHRQVVVFMVDIDHFKTVNDRFGHEAGDLVLREVAQCLRGQVRREDDVFRYGGEEFLVLMPECELHDVLPRAEAIREAVSRLDAVAGGRAVGRLTVSVGAAAFPQHGHTAADLLRAADAALYQAKQAGRDRVVHAESVLPGGLAPAVAIGLLV
jgi:diguanylate cyclase (GGDEF)-like protein/PAS domain S-box-containing protein